MSTIPLNFLRALFFCCTLITITDSSHFLGGTITWSIQNVSSDGLLVAIRITQTYSWTYVAGRCDGSAIANNQPVSSASGSLTCSPSCPLGFGSVSAVPYCTDVSPSNGIAIGQRLDTVVIPTGSNFFVIYAGSAWNSQITGASSWSITSHINVARRSDNNMFNNAPVATVMSPVNIQVNRTTIIPISVSDADGDFTRCRWASSNTSEGINECGTVCPPNSLPANTILYSNCTIQITGTIVGSLYALTFVVEDLTSSSSNSSISSVPVQFIIKVVAPPSCSAQPEVKITRPSCIPIKVNETFTSQLLAINHCGLNVSITDIATLSFSGMLQSSIAQLNSSIYYKNITWTPTISQLGYQVMCAMAVNSLNTQSSQYCFTFYVTVDGTAVCPGVTSNNVISTTRATSTTINWPLIGSFIVFILLLTIIYSFCLIHFYYKRLKNARQQRLYKNKLASTNSSSLSTREQSQMSSSITLIKSGIGEKPVNKAPMSPIFSVDENVVENIDVEEIFEPKIMYPRNHTIQTPANELKLSRMENESIQIRSIPLLVEDLIISNDLSQQIETIDLPPTSTDLQQIPQSDINSIISSGVMRIESMSSTESTYETGNVCYIYEILVDKPRKTKLKRKKLSNIHVTIRNSTKSKR